MGSGRIAAELNREGPTREARGGSRHQSVTGMA
jgi:hypothetical protein